MADNSTDVFVYNGEGAVVPRDVVRVRIDPSVLVIPEGAFEHRLNLKEVELYDDGLYEIGPRAFFNCTALREVQSSNGVARIGHHAFAWCNFTKFRSPPLVTTISQGMLYGCTGLFSLDLPEIIIQVEGSAFGSCHSLRNVALASNTVVGENNFQYCQIFYTFLARNRQLLMHYEVDLMGFKFTARCTTCLTTIQSLPRKS
jgi:hypothetical protein